MQCCCARSEFAAWITAEIVNRHLREINFIKGHRLSFTCRFSRVVDIVDENREPLISRAVRVHRTANFPCRLDLNAFGTGFDGIIWVNPFHEKIGMPVKIIVLRECTRVLRHTRGQQV